MHSAHRGKGKLQTTQRETAESTRQVADVEVAQNTFMNTMWVGCARAGIVVRAISEACPGSSLSTGLTAPRPFADRIPVAFCAHSALCSHQLR